MGRRHVKRGAAIGAAIAAGLSTLIATGAVGASASGRGAAATGAATTPKPANLVVAPSGTGCQLGDGVKHVVQITFDNVHFFRDNPNVPSDLELMPHLLDFLEQNGTVLSNNHTPLIAHTADDMLTTATGLYGDRQGMPIANDFQTYNADGTTDSASSFAYWTDPVYDTSSKPNPGHDTNPSMVYSATPPATANPVPPPTKETPAPWVPYSRAGCDVGEVSVANVDLENTSVDIPKVFGPNSPEAKQLAQDPDPYKDPEAADYDGIAVHCARADAFCATAKAVKFGQTKPSHTAAPDLLPDEPGGYNRYQALFGHRYVAPQLGAGTPNVTHNGYEVTNSSGNLVDLFGNQLDGEYLTNYPGFPGFGDINAAQTLAYMADMLETNVPVVFGYISDLHGNHYIPALSSKCNNAPSALATGTPCYIAQAQYYDQAFSTFFQRLAADGITTKNTVFVFSSDEGDHEAGANVGRAVAPTPAGCDGATVSGTTVKPDVICHYPAGTFGELSANVTGLLAEEKGATPQFSIEDDTAPEFYVTGQPAADAPELRTLEHDVAGLTASNPYSGNTHELLTNYLADPTEEAILHMVNADPARTPSFAMFAKPDYYLQTGSKSCTLATGPSGKDCVQQTTSYAWDHGDYAAEIDTNWIGIVGPGVARHGVDGSGPAEGPSSAGADSGQVTVPQEGTTGTWTDETDIRPTILYLTGLRDDYIGDGRVITQVLSRPASGNLTSPAVVRLAACYKQVNSSVGEFGTATLEAATYGLQSTSAGDSVYRTLDQQLTKLEVSRDRLAGSIKDELFSAEFLGGTISDSQASSQTASCQALIDEADHLAVSG